MINSNIFLFLVFEFLSSLIFFKALNLCLFESFKSISNLDIFSFLSSTMLLEMFYMNNLQNRKAVVSVFMYLFNFFPSHTDIKPLYWPVSVTFDL